MNTLEALNIHAQNISRGFKRAKVFYEDRIEIRNDINVFVEGDMIKVNLILDEENLGKVKNIQLLDEDGTVMKDRPFVINVMGDKNVYVGFWYRVKEKEITKDKYVGGGGVKYE